MCRASLMTLADHLHPARGDRAGQVFDDGQLIAPGSGIVAASLPAMKFMMVPSRLITNSVSGIAFSALFFGLRRAAVPGTCGWPEVRSARRWLISDQLIGLR